MSFIFNVFFYNPLYNGLIFLMDLLPWVDAGAAVILFTILVKLVLFPLSKKATVTQLKMKQLEKPLNVIKERYKGNREEQAKAVMSFYKENGINPFSSVILAFIQIPIILALYWVFYKGGLPVVDSSILYSFVKVPGAIDMNFLGFFNIADKSVLLAVIVGVTQFFQLRFSIPPSPPKERVKGRELSFKEEFARSMGVQMRYVFPFIAAFFAYSISGAIALYWTTSNLFAIAQELYLRRNLRLAANSANQLPANASKIYSSRARQGGMISKENN